MAENIIHKLLLVMDAATESKRAVDFALGLAGRLPCSLVAVYVIDTDMLQHLYDMHVLLKEERDDLLDDLEVQGRKALSELKGRCEKLKIDMADALQCRGEFNRAVMQAIQQTSADAVVVGGWQKNSSRSKDNSSIERHLLLDQAKCPVFVIQQ